MWRRPAAAAPTGRLAAATGAAAGGPAAGTRTAAAQLAPLADPLRRRRA